MSFPSLSKFRRIPSSPLQTFLPAVCTRSHWTTRPVKPRTDSDLIWEQDKQHFVHPWTHFESFKETGSLLFSKAEGPYVYDLDGKPYLDGIGGLWCVNAGYGRKEIVQAMAEQAYALPYFNTFADTGNIPAAQLAARLAHYTPPGLNKVFFTVCGSTANDTAVRLAHYYFGKQGKPSKKHVLSRTDAYHGSTYVAGSITGKLSDRSPYLHYITDWIHHLSSPNYDRAHEIAPDGAQMSEEEFCGWLLGEMEAKILALGPDNVALFFAEPLLGSGGVIVPPAHYIQRTRDLCTKYNILYVSDEVVTGFGRIGHIFSSQKEFGIVPDMIISAKGLTSGYAPLAACIFSEEIYNVVSGPDLHVPKKKVPYSASGNHPLGVFTNGYTYSGHPVSCAAGLANLAIFEKEDLCGHVRRVGPYLESQLRTLQDIPIVGPVRGLRFMLCIENVKNKSTKEYFADEVKISKRVADNCESVGLIVRPIGPLNIISPPLILDKEHIDELVGKLRQAYELTVADLHKDGHI